MNKYSFEEHLHRYAVWTAARAVNRDFAKNVEIRNAIEKSKMLRAYVTHPLSDASEYEGWHKKCAIELINAFKSRGIKCSFGRAAKIIAIYLKTALILPRRGKGVECKVIFPPIDKILLKAFLNCEEIAKKMSPKHRTYLKGVSWTKLESKADYLRLRRVISTYVDFDWTLERFWESSKD